jgi:hypothetical protein
MHVLVEDYQVALWLKEVLYIRKKGLMRKTPGQTEQLGIIGLRIGLFAELAGVQPLAAWLERIVFPIETREPDDGSVRYLFSFTIPEPRR